MKVRDKLMTFKTNATERRKIKALSSVRGLTYSQLMRNLIHNAFVQEIGLLRNGETRSA